MSTRREQGKGRLASLCGAYWRVAANISVIAALLTVGLTEFGRLLLEKVWKKGFEDLGFIEWFLLLLVLTPYGVLVYGVCILIRRGVGTLWHPGIRVALFAAARMHHRHMEETIMRSWPKDMLREHRPCNTLIQELIYVFSKASASLNERDFGPGDGGLLPANFDVYAQCVASLGEHVRRFDHSPEVYTIFRRPILDWYNLLSRQVITGTSTTRTAVYTSDWWEKYKKVVAQYSYINDAKLRMFRLLIHPPMNRDPNEYRVYTDDGYKHMDAKKVREVRALTENPSIQLMPAVDELIKAGAHAIPSDARVHLVGTASGIGIPGENWVSLIKHFEDAYHVGDLSPEILQSADRPKGAYYAYVEKVAEDLKEWMRYSDVFAIALYDKAGEVSDAFGIGLLGDSSIGGRGMKILDLRETKLLISAFRAQLEAGVTGEFCTCALEHDSGNAGDGE